jgi:hypothetical protein
MSYYHYYNNQSESFDPRDVSDLVLWLDAQDSSTITEISGKVSQWSDKSGSENHAVQSDSNNRPVYSADEVIFTNDNFVIPETTVVEAFFVISNITGNNGVEPLLGQYTSSQQAYTFLRALPSTDYTISVDGAAADDGEVRINNGSTFSGRNILVTGFNGYPKDSIKRVVNFKIDTPKVYRYIAALRTGATFYYANSRIHEVLLFSQEKTTTERGDIYEYLADKWSVS